MSTRRNGVLGMVIGALLAASTVLTTASPASAASAWFPDAKGDILASVDIERVQVVNDQDRKVQVIAELRNLRLGDVVAVWVDTTAADRGPEYRVQATANSGDLNVYAVDRWSSVGTVVPCDGLRVRMNGVGPGNRARFRVPRACLSDPASIRVSVNSSRLTQNGWQNDWAPRYRHWYPWVSSSASP